MFYSKLQYPIHVTYSLRMQSFISFIFWVEIFILFFIFFKEYGMVSHIEEH